MLIWARLFPLVQPAMATCDALLFKRGAREYCDMVKYGGSEGPSSDPRGQELDTVWTMWAGLRVGRSGSTRSTAALSCGPQAMRVRTPGATPSSRWDALP